MQFNLELFGITLQQMSIDGLILVFQLFASPLSSHLQNVYDTKHSQCVSVL